MSAVKRPAESAVLTPNVKRPKEIHPFFSGKADNLIAFKWLDKIEGSCLHGVTKAEPQSREKVALLDLDGTLVKSNGNKPVPADKWEWWHATVPKKLKELHESGHSIVIVSNQGSANHAKICMEKMPRIAARIPDVPFRMFAAPKKDHYRKPMTGTWEALKHIYAKDGVLIDKRMSFFVGDAAGRQYTEKSFDFSDSDLKYAENVGIPFYTPEQFFLDKPLHAKVVRKGFHPSTLPTFPLVTPTSTPLLPVPLKQELILFMGYPALGKSTFYERFFKPSGYAHVNQDTLKSREKCVREVRKVLAEGLSCVVDNTNRSISTRKLYLDISKKLRIPARCFWFSGSLELARHNNRYRAFYGENKRDLIPATAFDTYKRDFEEPTTNEGFTEIKEVHWVFEGTEEQRALWNMWYWHEKWEI